jgi:hypothetical protein
MSSRAKNAKWQRVIVLKLMQEKKRVRCVDEPLTPFTTFVARARADKKRELFAAASPLHPFILT